MTPREYLERPGETDREIRRRKDRVETLRRMATRLAPKLSGVSVRSSPDPGLMQSFLDEAADEEAEIRRLEEARPRILAETALCVSRVPDRTLARLLEYRYLEFRSWPDVAARLRLSETYVLRLHRKALALLPVPPEAGDPA